MTPNAISTALFFRSNTITTNISRQMLRLTATFAVVFCALSVQAQTAAPIVLPNTFSTVAGSSNGSGGVTGFTVGAACSAGSPNKATDVYGDGCLATQAVFGPDFQDGIHVDGQGNIWISDITNNWTDAEVGLLRKVDPKSGIITLISSSAPAAVCPTATATVAGLNDSNADGCPFANTRYAKERGNGIDPYGNLVTGSYVSGEVHIYCNAVSPLCPIAAGVMQTYSSAQKQVGYAYRIAGCISAGSGATAETGLTAGTAGDGYFATSFYNLPGDVAAWGTSNSGFVSTAGTSAGITGTTGVCGITTGGLNGARAVTADQYGNVFIHDGTNVRVRVIVGPPTFTLPGGTILTNPLPAIIAADPTYASVTAAQMYGRIYPIVGGFTASTVGATCGASSGTIAPVALDAQGDGCPWYNSTVSTTNPIGLTMDTTTENGTVAANLVFTDSTNRQIRVLYMGPTVSAATATASPLTYPMANAIAVNNSFTTNVSITKGSTYLLAGGTTALTAAPIIGNSASLSGYSRLTAAPNGNLYLGNITGTADTVAFYDLSTGYVRLLLQSAAATAGTVSIVGGAASVALNYCATPGQGDGQPEFSSTGAYSAAALTTNACFEGYGSGSSTLSVASDSQNNLYIGDDEIDTTGYGRSRVRKVLATQLTSTTLGAPITQTLRIHGAAKTTASATAITSAIYSGSSSEINVATPVCATTADAGATVDCLANVTFTPASPGIRSSAIALTDSSLSTGSTFPIFGTAIGSALVSDPSLPTKPVTASIAGTHTTPVGVAVDSNGDVFTMDTTAAKFTEISGSTITQLAGTLPLSPTQISLDAAGNLYAAGVGNSTLTQLALGSGGNYTAGTISIAGVVMPQAVAADAQGNLYVADKTTTSVYKIASATAGGSALPNNSGTQVSYQPIAVVASGLNSPTGIAIDGYGNIYIGDIGAGSIFRVDAKSGTMTTLLSGIHPISISADTAGDVYYQDNIGQDIVEIPYTTISNGVAGTTNVTILSSLTTPTGLAVAGNGNIYSSDSGAGTLTSISRNAFSYNFGTGSSGSATLSGTLTNVGNQAITGSNPSTNTTNFAVVGGSTNGCVFTASVLGAQAAGNACTFMANFVGLGSGAVSDVLTYLPTATTIGSMTLLGTLNSVSGTTTNLASLPGPTVLPGATVNLSATVATTTPVVGQTVSFLNGTATLGNGTTNASGVATYSFTAGAIGTVYSLQASFAATGSYGASVSAIQTLTVALTPTSVALAVSATNAYPNEPVALTATMTPAIAGEVITFLNGTITLGTGTTNASGVATYTLTPTTGGTYSLSAAFASDGKNYAASASSVQTLIVTTSAVTIGSTPTSITLAPGTSGQISLTFGAQAGFTGTATLGCSSPVSYITCATNLPVQTFSASTVATALGTITVAYTTSSLKRSNNGITIAMLAPLGLFGLVIGLRKRRRALSRLSMMFLFISYGVVTVCGITGCSTAKPTSSGTAPSGSQVVTFTATASGVTQSTTVTVNIN